MIPVASGRVSGGRGRRTTDGRMGSVHSVELTVVDPIGTPCDTTVAVDGQDVRDDA